MKRILVTVALTTSFASCLAAPINLNIIQVCDDNGKNCAAVNLNKSFTDKIWAQAGYTFSYGSVTQINSTKLLNPTDAEAQKLIFSPSGNGRSNLGYDVWFVNSISDNPLLRGRGVQNGDGLVISASNAAIDTFAHEIGHNAGIYHTPSLLLDSDRYLMAPGNLRTIPTTIGDVAPDGLQLDRFFAQFPEVTVDMIGATPFQSSDFFHVNFAKGSATDLGLSSLTIDLRPANAFFDVTNADPGVAGSPFAFGSLNGVTAGDISTTGLTDGSSVLTLNFANDSFTSGDSFSFGLDMDLFSNIDGFGATADELRSALVTFTFENGYSTGGDLSDLIFSSAFDPNRYMNVTSTRLADPGIEPNAVPIPSTIWLLGVGLILLSAFRNGNITRCNGFL